MWRRVQLDKLSVQRQAGARSWRRWRRRGERERDTAEHASAIDDADLTSAAAAAVAAVKEEKQPSAVGQHNTAAGDVRHPLTIVRGKQVKTAH